MLPGFVYAPYGNLEATRALVDDETAAIMLEPIQGEGGIKISTTEFIAGLRQLCDEKGLKLIFDEVQTGCGRTGHWFAYQHYGVEPDIMTLAKSLCGGVAGGAMLARLEIAQYLKPGTHAATFGGNPLAARAGIATIEMIEQDGLLENAKQVGELFAKRLKTLKEKSQLVKEVRVLGCMIGIELAVDGTPVVKNCLERKLLVNCTQKTVIRLLPAMNITPEQIEQGCDILEEVILGLTG
jgi:acetylornithine/N-succinyldiaminopimelate aminotransferase